jgi:hypothetical protein
MLGLLVALAIRLPPPAKVADGGLTPVAEVVWIARLLLAARFADER